MSYLMSNADAVRVTGPNCNPQPQQVRVNVPGAAASNVFRSPKTGYNQMARHMADKRVVWNARQRHEVRRHRVNLRGNVQNDQRN